MQNRSNINKEENDEEKKEVLYLKFDEEILLEINWPL